MPPVSQAQRRWAFANKDRRGSEGKAAREFAKADPGGKLPRRVKNGRPVKPRGERWYGKD
jgi:hypothetical protein